MHRFRLIAPPVMLCALFAGGCVAGRSHEYRAARHVEIAKHAFILQAIEDCEIADPDERGRAKFETGRLMTAYIGHLSSFGWADRRNDEDLARETWREIGTRFPLFQSASVPTESGEAANRLPLLLDDEWVRFQAEVSHVFTTSQYGGSAHTSVITTPEAITRPDSEPAFQQKYRMTGSIEVDSPYGFVGFEIEGTIVLSEFFGVSANRQAAKITDLEWTLVTTGEPIAVRLAPGRFDSRIVVDEFGLGDARLQVAFHSPEYPYLGDMYFNAILNIPIAASPDRRTIAFATLGAVRGTTIAPVQPLPSYEPREDRNCADDNGNGIPNFIEELSKSLDEVRHMMLEPY